MTPDWAAKPVTVPYAKFGDPQTLNLYSFVENAPVNRIDSDGHIEWAPYLNFGSGDPVNIGAATAEVAGAGGGMAGVPYSETIETESMQAAQENAAQNDSPSGPRVYPANFIGPLQPGDVRGPYVADLNSRQIAPLLDPNHKQSNSDVVGNGQCVSACKKFAGLEGSNTRQWRAGPKVANNGNIKPGTAIATFDSSGHYPIGPEKNSGIYLGPGTKGSIWILDQWPGHAPEPREVVFDNNRSPSNNSNAYSVIYVAP